MTLQGANHAAAAGVTVKSTLCRGHGANVYCRRWDCCIIVGIVLYSTKRAVQILIIAIILETMDGVRSSPRPGTLNRADVG